MIYTIAAPMLRGDQAIAREENRLIPAKQMLRAMLERKVQTPKSLLRLVSGSVALALSLK